MKFAHPYYFLLLLLLIPLIYLELRKRPATVRFSDLTFLKSASLNGKILRYIPFFINIIILVLCAIALARPQKGRIFEETEVRGVDIIICMDVSTSMAAEDFAPRNRLFVAKEKAKEFIDKRKGDRIGLVIFAGQAMTQCPLTFDRTIIKDLVDYIDFGILEDGTAIGNGLSIAISRLKDSRAKEKIIILLTDGINNRGEIEPLSAAKISQTFGIKIYCVGIGRNEPLEFIVNHPKIGRGYMRSEPVDMKTLEEIAILTGGKAFRATDAQALGIIYEEIDRLEPTSFKVSQHTVYSEKAHNYLLPGFILLVLNLILGLTFFRRLP